MDRKTIVKLARDAGWPDSLVAPVIMDKLADVIKLAAAHEREACAKVCEEDGLLWGQRYADAIRARGEA